MKGIIKLKDIETPVLGMQVLFPTLSGWGIDVVKVLSNKDVWLSKANEWNDAVFEKEELKQLVIEYKCPSIKREGESCPKNNNCKYPECSILPIPEDDWERNIGRVGEEVEFVKWDGGRQCIGEPEIQPVAWVQEPTPPPILYTEEQLRKRVVEIVREVFVRGQNFEIAALFRDELKRIETK